MKTFILFMVLFFNGFAQTDTSKILLTFNERMGDYVELTNPANYKITDPNNVIITVYKVGRVKSDRSNPKDSTQVVVFCKRLNYNKTYKIVVSNVRDWSSNLINPLHDEVTFIFNGFAPNRIQTPNTLFKK